MFGTKNRKQCVERVEGRIYVKCTEANKWRSTKVQQKKWRLYCNVGEEDLFVAEFIIVGDSKTRAHLMELMVCETV